MRRLVLTVGVIWLLCGTAEASPVGEAVGRVWTFGVNIVRCVIEHSVQIVEFGGRMVVCALEKANPEPLIP